MAAEDLALLELLDEARVDVARLCRRLLDLLQPLVVAHHGLVSRPYVLLVDEPHVVVALLRVPHYY